MTINFLFLRHRYFINLFRMILFSYFLIFYYHDHTIIQILYKNSLTSKGNKQVSFHQSLPNNVAALFKVQEKKNIKEANLKWGVGAVLFSERCLGHLTRFFKNFVANLSYQIRYKI